MEHVSTSPNLDHARDSECAGRTCFWPFSTRRRLTLWRQKRLDAPIKLGLVSFPFFCQALFPELSRHNQTQKKRNQEGRRQKCVNEEFKKSQNNKKICTHCGKEGDCSSWQCVEKRRSLSDKASFSTIVLLLLSSSLSLPFPYLLSSSLLLPFAVPFVMFIYMITLIW